MNYTQSVEWQENFFSHSLFSISTEHRSSRVVFHVNFKRGKTQISLIFLIPHLGSSLHHIQKLTQNWPNLKELKTIKLLRVV